MKQNAPSNKRLHNNLSLRSHDIVVLSMVLLVTLLLFVAGEHIDVAYPMTFVANYVPPLFKLRLRYPNDPILHTAYLTWTLMTPVFGAIYWASEDFHAAISQTSHKGMRAAAITGLLTLMFFTLPTTPNSGGSWIDDMLFRGTFTSIFLGGLFTAACSGAAISAFLLFYTKFRDKKKSQ